MQATVVTANPSLTSQSVRGTPPTRRRTTACAPAWMRCLAVQQLMVAVPLLAGLAEVDDIEQVRRHCALRGSVAHRPEVGDRHLLVRRLVQQQEHDGCVRALSELLQLTQRRQRVAREPCFETRKARTPHVVADARAHTSPPQQFGTHLDTHRHRSSIAPATTGLPPAQAWDKK